MALVGRFFGNAHDFTSPAVMPDGAVKENFRLSEYIAGRYALLFFYTMDFSVVCGSEMLALANRERAFAERDTEVVVISGDSHLSHRQWRASSAKGGGVGNFPYPMVSDISRNVARGYGLLVNDSVTLRGAYIIDNDGYFRHESVHDLSVGRNIDDLIRIIDAQKEYQKTGMLCPSGWRPGEETLKSDPDFMVDYLGRNAKRL